MVRNSIIIIYHNFLIAFLSESRLPNHSFTLGIDTIPNINAAIPIILS